MPNSESKQVETQNCQNCETEFKGNFCPNCGQSVKEFQRPVKFLIVDFMGNMFAFDTRFWKTLIAVLFKPGKLENDFVKGHRVKYMPPFRFYLFISFIFFLLLNIYTSRMMESDDIKNALSLIDENQSNEAIMKADSLLNTELKDVALPDSVQSPSEFLKKAPKDELQMAKLKFLKEHPEIFLEKFLARLSWAMFLLMPFYGLLLWLFYRKSQPYYVTHFIMAINQHAFMFLIFVIALVLALLLPNLSSSFYEYFLWIIPIYFIIGHQILYKQKVWKTIIKSIILAIFYFILVFIVAISLVTMVTVESLLG